MLILGEAIETMRDMSVASVDHIITDPPYNLTGHEWDKDLDWGAWWRQASRLLHPGGNIIMFTAQPSTSFMLRCRGAIKFRYELIWIKSRPSGHLNTPHRPLQQHENILVFHAGNATYNPQMGEGKPKGIINRKPTAGTTYGTENGATYVNNGERHPTTVLTYQSADRPVSHPTEKPLPLMTHLVLTYTDAGQTILDPFMGSGTTGVAAAREERQFIGIELSPEYHAIAEQRIGAAIAQPRLIPAGSLT